MNDKSAKSRMERLFISYDMILEQNGLSWLTKKQPKIAIQHINSAIKPYYLRTRIEGDIKLSQSHLKKDFSLFMQHAIMVSNAFQLSDGYTYRTKSKSTTPNLPTTQSNKGNKVKKHVPSKHKKEGKEATSSTANTTQPSASSSNTRPQRPLPPCPFPACKEKSANHLVKNCPLANDAQKKDMMTELIALKNAGGPSTATRSQTSAPQPTADGTAKKPITRRVRIKSSTLPITPDNTVTIGDGLATLQTVGRCDDGCDDSIASSNVAEKASSMGIGRISKIPMMEIQLPLKNTDSKPIVFSCQRTWTVPRTILSLSSGRLALCNISYLVVDGELTDDQLLIGLPVLQHLKVDTRTLLERHKKSLDGTDCLSVGNPTIKSKSATVKRLVTQQPNLTHDYRELQQDEDPFLPDYLEAEPPEISIIDNALNKLVHDALEQGLPPEHQEMLKELIFSKRHIFCLGLSDAAPATFPPLSIDLEQDAKPVRVKLRKYSEAQRDFMKSFVADLIRCGMAYPNPTSIWAAAPLLVPKPTSSNSFRFTVDLRLVNKYTKKQQYPMPNIENELSKLFGSTCYANFDLSSAYWQLPLHPDFQATQSFITPDGIFSPTRVLHGTTNAVTYLQSSLTNVIPATLSPHTLLWLDDILIHSQTPHSLLESISRFLSLCDKHNLRLHPEKCIIFTRRVRWCGRIIDGNGVTFDPRNLNGLQQMQSPTTGAQLQQFVCALQWVKSAVPNFSALTAPLHYFMEKVYTHSSSRKKNDVGKISLKNLGWSETEENCFVQCKHALSHQVTLTHRDPDKRLSIFTDASDTGWSGILTQVPFHQLQRPFDEQNHQPLAFLSGQFNKTQLSWSTIEKETYAIISTVERMHWMLAHPSGFDIYTDHNNIVFLFDPRSIMPNLSISSTRKVLRWAVSMARYNYICMHIKGKDNLWADIMSRWTQPSTIVRRLVLIPPLTSSLSESFDWPGMSDIIEQQQQYPPADLQLHYEDNVLRTKQNKIWIPNPSQALQLRILIGGHSGVYGHRGQDITIQNIEANFFWDTLREDCKQFVRKCIHFLSTTGGRKVPRPFGPSFFGDAPNALLQFDYLKMDPSFEGSNYLLVIKDDFSSYCWLLPFAKATADNAADSLLEWSTTFTVPDALMSDGGSHFKNETVRILSKSLRVPHHFTLPYTPWSNGSIERLNKEVLRILRSTLSELQLPSNDWTSLVPILQSALNNSSSRSRANKSPITIFTGLPAKRPFDYLKATNATEMTLDEAVIQRQFNLDHVHDLLNEVHPMVSKSLQHHRQYARDKQSKGKLPNFEPGDYVLVSRQDMHKNEKLSLRWTGPRMIIRSISQYIYTVRDLHNDTLEDIHACRLKFFSNDQLNKSVIMSHILYSETGMEVQRLLKIIDSTDGLFVLVRWKGLPPDEDSLEPLQNIYNDVPVMTRKLLNRKNTPDNIRKQAKKELGL